MERLFRFFASRPLLAGIFTLSAIGLGLAAIGTARLSEYPDIRTGYTEVTTIYPGASPEDVETNVTNKIERELLSVFEIDRFGSTSLGSTSIIYIKLKANADMEIGNQRIREAVQRVTDLPREVRDLPLVEEEKTATLILMIIGVSGDIPYDQLHAWARRFEKKIRQVPGVGRIKTIGLNQREIQVQLNPERLGQFGLSLNEVASAIEARHLTLTGGTLESYADERSIVVMSELRSAEGVGEVIVRPSKTGPLVRIRDLGTIENGFERKEETMRINGKNVIAFEVSKAAEGDVISTVRAIKKLIANEEAEMPEDVEIDVGYDLSVDIENRFSIVTWNGMLGLILVLIVLGASLGFRTAFWVAVSIPVTLLGATIFLVPIAGGLDSASMGALLLVVGIIVDDSIVVSEAIQSHLEKGKDLFDAAANGLKEVSMPVVTGMMTTAIVFIPLFFLPGTVGKVVYVIPLTVLLALTVSLIECFFVLPAHVVHRTPASPKRKAQLEAGLHKYYRASLSVILRFRYAAVSASIVVLILVGGAIVRNLDFIMFPKEAGRIVSINAKLDPGLSIEASEVLNRKVEGLLTALPDDEVMSWLARISPPDIEYVLSLTHLNKRERSAMEIVDQLRGDIASIKGLKSVTFEINGGGPSESLPVEVRITGGADDVRLSAANDLVEFLGTLPGIHDISRDDAPGKGEVSLDLDYLWLARHGLTVADIARTLRISHEGEVVSTTWFGDERVDIRVNLIKEFRGEDYLLNLKAQNSSGELVSFKNFARLVKRPGVSELQHWNGVRSIVVSSDLDFDLNTPIEIEKAAHEWFDHTKYSDVSIGAGGQAEDTMQAMRGLGIALVAAFLAIYFLLAILFNSLKQPILILSVVPFGLFGVVAAVTLHGQPLAFTGAIGAIGLIGVVVNGAIVLVHRINKSRAEMPDTDVQDIVIAAASDRLRPIVLTVLTTTAGMIPLTYGIGGVDVFMGPMALSLGFGLLLSSPVILFLVPCFYVIMADFTGN